MPPTQMNCVGIRVQYSFFNVEMSGEMMNELINRLLLLIDKRNLPVITIDDECLNNLTYIDPDKGIFSMLNNVELFDTEELLLARVFEIMSHEFFCSFEKLFI